TVNYSDIYSNPWVPALNAFNRKMLSIKANGEFKLENEGYWGMNIEKGSAYTFQVAAFCSDGFNSPLKIRIVGSDGVELASGEVKGIEGKWKYYTVNFSSSGSDSKAHLEIIGEGKGSLYLDMVSLMPD